MKAVQNDLLPRFRNAIDWSTSIKPGSILICGYSGGPDSTALLDLLTRLAPDINITVVAAHLNHGLRGPDSESDEFFAGEFCRCRNIELELSRCSTLINDADDKKISIEMAARDARRKFLSEIAIKHGTAIIALGHTADDRIENLLLRLLRGSGGRGLGSLRPVKNDGENVILRPLLDFHRHEIIAYLNSRDLPYRTDTSNETIDTERGRVRNVILPELERLTSELGWSRMRESLARSASLLADDEEFLSGMAIDNIKNVELIDGNSLRLRPDLLSHLPSPILSRLILHAIDHIAPGIRPSREHIDTIVQILVANVGEAFDIPCGFSVEKDGGSVIVRKKQISDPVLINPVRINLNNLPVELEFGPYHFFISLENIASGRTQTGVGLSHDRVSINVTDGLRTLILRTPLAGDRMSPLGMDNHTKKISDIFVDRKIPKCDRDTQPVLIDESTGSILALPVIGLVSDLVKVTNTSTRLIEIHWTRAEP
jgi:tRNA(Ile)-lysidine synthase